MKCALTLLASGAAVAGLAAASQAEPPARDAAGAAPVVVELFSSQSCGKCPEANRNLIELADEEEQVIALTYAVGIWDYLGWSDTFAKPEFTQRQVAYNRNLGHRGPYTPQVVVNGVHHCSGVDVDRIEQGMEERGDALGPVSVKLSGAVAELSGDYDGKAVVTLVHFRPGLTPVTPAEGANRGKTIRHLNLVTRIEPLGEYTGGEASFRAYCTSGCAVLVQSGPEGEIIAAAARE
jgi:hypothetical protein